MGRRRRIMLNGTGAGARVIAPSGISSGTIGVLPRWAFGVSSADYQHCLRHFLVAFGTNGAAANNVDLDAK
jgi:hypothetical protein